VRGDLLGIEALCVIANLYGEVGARVGEQRFRDGESGSAVVEERFWLHRDRAWFETRPAPLVTMRYVFDGLKKSASS
jgi:hypothetical protein